MKDIKDMKRILLKLSGEALAGPNKRGFDEATCIDVARQIKEVVDSGVQVAETHFPKYSGDLYGRDIVVRLSDFIRPEKRFNNTDELRAQINNDVNKVMTAEMLPEL